MTKLYTISAKEKGEKRFKMLDLSEMKYVVNVIHATVLTENEANKVIANLRQDNPEVEFKLTNRSK